MSFSLPNDPDDERLVRFLRGECSRDEVHAIEEWANASAERRSQLDVVRRAWLAASGRSHRGDVEKGWVAIAAKLDDPIELTTKHDRSPRVLRVIPAGVARSRWSLVARAAGIALVVGLTGLLLRNERRDKAPASSALAGAMREITTKPGQRADVYLSDGTHVILGVASHLRFPAVFGASRDVELRGQAYFDVVHDAARPFAVHTARAVARDLGTKFDVRAYADSEDVAVAVTEGAVMLTSAPRISAEAQARIDSAALRRSDVGVVSPDGKLTARHGVDMEPYVAWTVGRLVFRQTPGAEAVAQLNRWYGADVRLGDSTLASIALTMSVTNESLAEAIDILARALDARIERRGTVVALYARSSR